MCISLQDFKVKLDKKGVGVGWKVFRRKGNKIYGLYAGKNKFRPPNIWLNEKDFRPTEKEERGSVASIYRYAPAWHLFLTRREARKYSNGLSVKKVKFRQVIATGITARFPDSLRTIVAKEIFVS